MSKHALELLRYGVNGLIATAVHYGVLTVNLSVLNMSSAGLANLLAATVGISVSFLGCRYFVFRNGEGGLIAQAVKFSGLYGAIALLHGLVLLTWTDWAGHDYRTGFLLATAMQVSLSYVGNKFLIFNA